jgi:hypothetical protein
MITHGLKVVSHAGRVVLQDGQIVDHMALGEPHDV